MNEDDNPYGSLYPERMTKRLNLIYKNVIQKRGEAFHVCHLDENFFERLEKAFTLYPLDKEFIDWVNERGFKVIRRKEFPKYFGSMNLYPNEINVSSNADSELVKLVLAHELAHLSFYRVETNHLFVGEDYKRMEEAVEKIAQDFVKDKELIQYAMEKLPSLAI